MILTREDVIASRMLLSLGNLAMIIGIVAGIQYDSPTMAATCSLLIIIITALHLPVALRKVP